MHHKVLKFSVKNGNRMVGLAHYEKYDENNNIAEPIYTKY